MAVSKIERSYHRAFISKSYTHNFTIAANSATAVSAANLGINAIDGYSIAVMTGYDINDNNMFCRYLVPKSSGTVAVIRNIAAFTVNAIFTVHVLWVRSDMF